MMFQEDADIGGDDAAALAQETAAKQSTLSLTAHGMRLLVEHPELAREHRAFGIGTHYCLGAHPARMEMQIMFEEIVPRLRNPRFAEPVKYMRDFL
ncbi:MAG: hypothetical protein R3E54_16405 [Halioglobus sp.]